MASLLDSIGQIATPQNTATSSLPDSLKSMFAPLMETMVRDAQMRNDPISRLGDVGLAALDASGGGTPFAKSLGALDTQRQQAMSGAGNMFLQIMSLDKQLEQLKSDQAYKNADLALKMVGLQPNFAKDMAEFDSKIALRDDLPAETKARMRAEFEANWKRNYGSSLQPSLRTPPGIPTSPDNGASPAPPARPMQATNPEAGYQPGAVKSEALPDPASPETWLTMTKGWLNDLGRSELQARLSMDKNFQDSVSSGDTTQAGRLFQLHALDVAQQGDFVEAKAGVRPAQPAQPAPPTQPTAPPNAVPEPPPGANPKEWRDAMTKKAADEAIRKRQARIGQFVAIQEMEKALDMTKSEDLRTGMAAGLALKHLSTTGAWKLNQSLETIKGSSSLEQLNQMRQASNTGASGLGQVTTYEHKLLQSVLGPLDVGMGNDLAPNLLRAMRIYKAIVMFPNGIQPGMEQDVLSGKYDSQLGIDPNKYKKSSPAPKAGDGWKIRPIQ